MSVIDTTVPASVEPQDIDTDQPDEPGDTAAAAPEAQQRQDSPEPSTGYLAHLDPTTLTLEDNIRTDADLDKAFVDSVRDQGVLQPVRAYLADDGTVTVRDGHLRVLAAIEAARPTVPVYVVDPGQGVVSRVTEQYDANERRTAMSDTDRIGAWRQLQLEGLSVTAIAKATHTKRTLVRAGLDVATSDTATDAVVKHDLTLDQAAVLIEFEDDPKSVKKMLDVARTNPTGFVHEAQRIRDQRKINQQIADLTADFTQRGVPVIAWPRWDDKDTVPLKDLTEADGSALNPETFATRPGYRVAIRESYQGVEVGHFVTDWRTHGLKKRRSNGSTTVWTDQQKRERRDLIANNKAWDSAQVVRREWLGGFLARTKIPKDAAAFAAMVAVEYPSRWSSAIDTHHELAANLLGGTREFGKKHPLTALVEANPAKAVTVLLALAVAALESGTGRGTWRAPMNADVAYFTALRTWGYTLSDVENLVLGIKPEQPADETDEALPADTDDDATEPQDDESDDDQSEDESNDGEPEDDDSEQ